MKALIVDDEAKAREILELLLRVHVPEIQTAKLASSGREASVILQNYQPDLVFLDIKMPEMNGFEWLASLQERPFDVIFATAYDQYAIQAIRYAAFDYLLKPVDVEDLRNCMDRYIASSTDRSVSYDNLLYNISQSDPRNFRLTIATTEETHYLDPAKIIRLEADGNYTHFHLSDQKQVLASRPLGYYANLLPDVQFIRCHKSHLVNRNCITSIFDKKLKLNDGAIVDVSRRRMAGVRASMES